ncbi:MAG: hypothetical protein O6934_03415 [SAR324 cluster bacterium]|nr:hypothetical protein [SAR324 cluster bacterium]
MDIETYFGFFSKSVFTAMAGAIGSFTGKPVSLEEVSLATTNTIKLRWSEVDTVLIPVFATPVDVKFVLALTPRDTAGLNGLVQGRGSLQRLMEQAVSTAVEPFNFIFKTRNKLTGLRFSRNVTGLTAHHLDGEVTYTMAVGRLGSGGGQPVFLRLLVTAQGRDTIEERASQANTQRALFSINEGAYIPSPQWEPPPPPPGAERSTGLSESLMNAWIQTFFALNDGTVPSKVFKRPAAQLAQVIDAGALQELEGQQDGITVTRLLLNGEKAQEVIVLLPEQAERSLMGLSKSGQSKFLGDFFRVYYGEAAQLWARFSGAPMSWRVLGTGKIPASSLRAVTSRLEGGGLTVVQEARFDEGRVRWFLAITPHAWRCLLGLTAKAMGLEPQEPPDREAIFAATGWGEAGLPWQTLISFCSDQELMDLARQFAQAKFQESHMAAVAAGLDEGARERWLTALSVSLRERTQAYELDEGEGAQREIPLAEALIAFNRNRKLPPGKLSDWVSLYAEMVWAKRQNLIDRLLPLRHLVYGMDRNSLSRLLFDVKGDVLTDLICGAEFPVVDQVRRAISPGFALRLFEDVGVRRTRASAYMVQEAQLNLYRTCHRGLAEGRYMLRATPAQRLGEIMRWLDEPA